MHMYVHSHECARAYMRGLIVSIEKNEEINKKKQTGDTSLNFEGS